MTHTLVLASASPQRARLLEQQGLAFEVAPTDTDETPDPEERPAALVTRLACGKARAVSTDYPQARILGADTVVTHEEELFGKPRDRTDARRILSRLSGTTHKVYTGVALLHDGGMQTRTVVSEVTLDTLDETRIDAYWATGEPTCAAGSYAIQGRGAQLVTHLSGSFSAVMGLPVHETVQLLKASGLDPLLSADES